MTSKGESVKACGWRYEKTELEAYGDRSYYTVPAGQPISCIIVKMGREHIVDGKLEKRNADGSALVSIFHSIGD